MNPIRSLVNRLAGKKTSCASTTWVVDAQKAVRQKQIGKAKEILRKGLARNPEHEDGWLLLGGMLDEADVATRVSIYQSAVLACPDSAELHFKLGRAMQDAERIDDALASYGKAAALRENFAKAQNNLGCLHLFRGDKKTAETYFRQAVYSDHSLSNAHYNLSAILLEQGLYEDAFGHLKNALEFDPDNDETLDSLVNVLAAHKRLEDAEAIMREALSKTPECYGLINNLGRIYRLLGQSEEAIAWFSRASEIRPSSPSALVNLGQTYFDLKQYEQSFDLMAKALHLDPRCSNAMLVQGCCLYMWGRPDEAAQTFRTLTATHPHSASTFIYLGAALVKLDQHEEAEECFRRATELDPHNSDGFVNLGVLLEQRSEHTASIHCYQRALELSPKSYVAHSNMLLTLNYFRGNDAQSLFLEHVKWAKNHAEALVTDDPLVNDRSPDRKLRVGYISPDFKRHSVAYFLEPVLEHHDRSRFEIYCYSGVLKEDAVTLRFKQHANKWAQIVRMSDEAVVQQVRKDNIDILVDLSGHTGDNRLLVFARRAAPIQVTYLGYPNTTGLGSMDFRLTDAVADPPGQTDEFHTEKLWRLPNTFLCYRPSVECPDVVPREGPEKGQITFASFNHYSKVTAEIVALWAKVLLAVPDSRMIIKAVGLENRATQRNLLERFSSLGITSNRISIHTVDPDFKQHIARYGHIDIALDTFPYSGTTTTCEALWMGVPVITRAGRTHVSRVTASLLTTVGLQELIADTDSAYVEKAVALARDPARLRELRQTMRARMAASPLMSEATFARRLETAYRAMWQEWCKNHSSAPC